MLLIFETQLLRKTHLLNLFILTLRTLEAKQPLGQNNEY